MEHVVATCSLHALHTYGLCRVPTLNHILAVLKFQNLNPVPDSTLDHSLKFNFKNKRAINHHSD